MLFEAAKLFLGVLSDFHVENPTHGAAAVLLREWLVLLVNPLAYTAPICRILDSSLIIAILLRVLLDLYLP